MDHIENETVYYFFGKGMAFIKPYDMTICILGGRNFEESNFEKHKEVHSTRKYLMSEFNLKSNIWNITRLIAEHPKENNQNYYYF